MLVSTRSTHILVAAAGRGSRMGQQMNKQFLRVGGEPIIIRCLRLCSEFLDSLEPETDRGLHVICSDNEMDTMQDTVQAYGLGSAVTQYIAGGNSRRESIFFGLQALAKSGVPDDAIIMIHDGARCLASADLFARCRDTAIHYGSACPGLPVHDTLRRAFSHAGQDPVLYETVSRELLFSMQTPQCFGFEEIMRANQVAEEAVSFGRVARDAFTDDVSVAQAAGLEVRLVEGENTNLKLTRPEDIQLAEAILAAGLLA